MKGIGMAKESSSTASPANKADGNLTSNADANGLAFMAGQARESGTPGDAVGVDKIRDLLFGNQMQDYDRRFAQMEQRFLQRIKDIERETAQTFSAFETNAKNQVDSLAAQLREEKEQRADADKENE